MTTVTESELLKKLEEWERKDGSLPKSLEFYRRLLSIQSDARLRASIPDVSPDEGGIDDRIRSGKPILTFDDLSIDWALMRDTFALVITLCADYPEVLGKVTENLVDSTSNLTYLKEATEVWFKEGQLPPQASLGSLKGAILEFTIQAALRPFLLNSCQTWLRLVNQEHWRRGYCPICGGSPDFAFLDRESGARWLLCSRCDAEWLFQRLECPYCGTEEPGALSYFTDDEGLSRLYVCERCHHYLKAFDLRRTKDKVLFPLERILTIDLDFQANSNGYHLCTNVR